MPPQSACRPDTLLQAGFILVSHDVARLVLAPLYCLKALMVCWNSLFVFSICRLAAGLKYSSLLFSLKAGQPDRLMALLLLVVGVLPQPLHCQRRLYALTL
jgi:hypothetical protein